MVVTDSEIDNYLALAKAQGCQSGRISAGAHSGVGAGAGNAKPGQEKRTQTRAEEALRQLEPARRSGQIAAVSPDSNDAAQGGSLAGVRLTASALYSDTASKLRSSQIGEVLRSANGFHCSPDRQTAGRAKGRWLNRTKPAILVRVNDLVSESEAKAKSSACATALGGAKFEDVAKLGSKDGSAQRR